MNIKTCITASVTILIAVQAAGLALAFDTAAPADATAAAPVCAPATERPSGHDNLVDINSAPRDWLVWIGLSEPLAEKIIGRRPYETRGDLVTRGLLPPADFARIKNRIIVRHV
jgi:hypothetical protein